jgi:uncharacterized membrane protein YkoI
LIYVSVLSGWVRHSERVKNRRKTMILHAGAAVLAAAALTAMAVPAARADEHEQDEFHEAVERGDIRSLADILSAIRDKLPGEVVGVEVEHKEGRWLYEFRVVDREGRLFEVYVDARTAAVERTREK